MQDEYVCSLNSTPETRLERKYRLYQQLINHNPRTRGVRLINKKWEASITYNKKRYYLGCFSNKIDALKAYNEAAIKYHGDQAILNFVPEGESSN